jgi:hypothetical protein
MRRPGVATLSAPWPAGPAAAGQADHLRHRHRPHRAQGRVQRATGIGACRPGPAVLAELQLAAEFAADPGKAQRRPSAVGGHSRLVHRTGRRGRAELGRVERAVTAGRTGVEIPLDAAVEALTTTSKPPRWSKNDVRGQILTYCVQSPTVGELAARLSLPLGATRFLVDDLVTQGYLRVHTPRAESMPIDERRELIRRTLVGLRAL